ncbi:HAD family hydrolase [Puteibacter caeruleilacunae]|nr:HAD family hydrolase [Puteibacter caeruleilacunae]
MDKLQQQLKELKPTKDFFIGIDSDGCVFDTMEIKQKECFCPNLIKHWNLQPISKYARETWEFVNLYSKTRGINRFLALIRFFELIVERPEVKARNFEAPNIQAVKDWVSKETKLGNPALERYVSEVNDAIINQTFGWSVAVNETITGMVHGMPPFPYVKESLERITLQADAIVVSQTPVEALVREWKENDIEHLVSVIAGQEFGTKTEHIALAAKGKYPDNKILMIGDAPGDFKAAKSNGVLFYPINPGHEEKSWERFYKEALPKFYNMEYEGDYEQSLIEEFDAYLPEDPDWETIQNNL